MAGVIGLATAVIGLAGTALAVWAPKEKAEVQPIAAAAAPEESLEGLPAMIDGYMSGPAFVDWHAANQLCYQKDKNDTCFVTAVLAQRGPRSIRMRETYFSRLPNPAFLPLDMVVADDFAEHRRERPDGVARVDLVDYDVTREGLCVNLTTRAAGASRTLAFGIDEGVALIPLTSSGLAAYRAQLREDLAGEAIGDSQCWRYRLENGRLRQDYFIDGVLQPDGMVMFDPFPADREVYLRIPD